jgi:hypothetical protein
LDARLDAQSLTVREGRGEREDGWNKHVAQ